MTEQAKGQRLKNMMKIDKDKKKIFIYDTLLRDGSQGEGIVFNGEDKIEIALLLDEFGIDFIEGGWPGSNPKDSTFFEKMKKKSLKNAQLVAFGSTHRKNVIPSDDKQLNNLLKTEAEVITIFGKTWDFHVEEVLKTTLSNNLKIIENSVAHLSRQGRKVIYDAEHFFDGMKNNPDYAFRTLKAAVDGGAGILTLCDTNGGSLPSEIQTMVAQVVKAFDIPIGIHCHNDSDLAVANTLMAVKGGASHVQGVLNGYGERCGNANLCSIIPNLVFKMGYDCFCKKNIHRLRQLSLMVSERANMVPLSGAAYVGSSDFAHTGGMHVDAVKKNPLTFEHIQPESIGNKRRILISELSGKSNILLKAEAFGFDLSKDSNQIIQILDQVKQREKEGYSYEGADASLKVFFHHFFQSKKKFFDIKNIVSTVSRGKQGSMESEVDVDILAGSAKRHRVVARAKGPVEALDKALREALSSSYPLLKNVSLIDYKVRVLSGKDYRSAKVVVFIKSRDYKSDWTTIGVSENIVEASLYALLDSFEYKLFEEE